LEVEVGKGSWSDYCPRRQEEKKEEEEVEEVEA